MIRLLLATLLLVPLVLPAQGIKPDGVSISYFGEMITHPGVKVSLQYPLGSWSTTHQKGKGESIGITRQLTIQPAVGFFYHKRYQTGFFLTTDISYTRQNERGGFYGVGVGVGYLRSFIPHVFEINGQGQVEKSSAGHHYFLPSLHLYFGNTLNEKLGWFVKPQFLYALPNFPKGTGYFSLEIGITRHLNVSR